MSRENFQLHADSVRAKDEVAKELNEKNINMQRLEERIVELQYVLADKDSQLSGLEKEKNKLKDVSWMIKIFFLIETCKLVTPYKDIFHAEACFKGELKSEIFDNC